MADHTTQAKNLRDQAQKKLTSFSIFGSKTARYEDAAELYKKAANLFKVAKQDNEAANSYIDAANCYAQTPNNGHEIAACYVKASGCYKKENYKESVAALEKALSLYTTDGRFGMAAKYEKEIAEIYENNNDVKNAIPHYETAAQYFEGENSTSTANGCLLKVAHFAAEAQDYKKAITIFEDVSKASINNKLLQYSVKEYLFKAALCNLCAGDIVEAKKALGRYTSMDMNFSTSREFKLISTLTDAVENSDEEAFDNALEEFTHITPMDQWKTSLLSIMQDKIRKGDGEDSDGVL